MLRGGLTRVATTTTCGSQQIPLPCAPREEWAQARCKFFSCGKNRVALDAIERAAFFVALDEESHQYNPDEEASLSLYGKALLHGNCYNRCGPSPTPPVNALFWIILCICLSLLGKKYLWIGPYHNRSPLMVVGLLFPIKNSGQRDIFQFQSHS